MLSRPSRPLALGVGLIGVVGTLSACAQPAVAEHRYVDGLYAAVGDYQSPEGAEWIGVALKLEDGVVSWMSVTPGATVGTPRKFQDDFAAEIATQVVGVELDQLRVSRVAGSSLTSEGFNNAVDQIKSNALEP